MNVNRRMVVAALAAAVVAPLVLAAQDLHPSRRPSPLGMARTTLGDAYVRVVYGRPYKRDRKNIFGTKESGAVVIYGERWRTGANEATELTVTRDVLVGGQKLPAGTYSLSTTPAPGTWKVHINSKLGLDGLGIFANNTFTPVDLAPTDVLTVSASNGTAGRQGSGPADVRLREDPCRRGHGASVDSDGGAGSDRAGEVAKG